MISAEDLEISVISFKKAVVDSIAAFEDMQGALNDMIETALEEFMKDFDYYQPREPRIKDRGIKPSHQSSVIFGRLKLKKWHTRIFGRY